MNIKEPAVFVDETRFFLRDSRAGVLTVPETDDVIVLMTVEAVHAMRGRSCFYHDDRALLSRMIGA